MIRREFIKLAGESAATAVLLTSAGIAEQGEASGRQIVPINRSWRYHPAKVEGAEAPEFDDSKFERIMIPHTNIKLPWHNFDDKDFTSSYPHTVGDFDCQRGPKVSASSLTSKV